MCDAQTSTPIKPKRASHLVHTDKLPEDAVIVNNYGSHSFNNLYYSPEQKKLYQQYKKRIREIATENDEHGVRRNIYVRTAEGKTIYISMKKLGKILAATNSKDNPLELPHSADVEAEEDAEAEAEEETSEKEAPKPKQTRRRKNDAEAGDKITFVKGKNTKSQVGVLTDASSALKEATATKHRRSKKITVDQDDLKL